MKKVLVLGCSGSGKSTFAIKLHKLTDIPLYHLDNIWWKADRTHITRDEFDVCLDEIINRDSWIIDGDYSRTYEKRIAACDTVFFLDYGESVCMEAIKGRVGQERPDIPWIEEELDPKLEEQVRNYERENRPRLMELFSKYPGINIITFSAREEAEKWITEKSSQKRIQSMKQVFESENICFVQVSELLVNDYLEMVNDEKNYTSFTGGKVKQFTVEQEIKWVHEKLEEKAMVFSMIEKKSGRFIGNIELMDSEDSERELGIAITAKMQNRGFGTEAVRALTEYGLNQLGLSSIFLRTNPNNARAIHVYKKCGFREYDRTDEHVYMKYAGKNRFIIREYHI